MIRIYFRVESRNNLVKDGNARNGCGALETHKTQTRKLQVGNDSVGWGKIINVGCAFTF